MSPRPRGPALLRVEHHGVVAVHGPLLVLSAVQGTGWDEFAQVRVRTDGTQRGDRHGVVLEVDRDVAVVQVLEGTDGLVPETTGVVFTGSPLRVPVGPGWLGRVCNGRGEPVDGGPPITGTSTAAVAGAPLNPTRRVSPAEPVLTGISVIDALTTLVRGQKLPVFSAAGLPHLELAAQIAAQSTAGGDPFSVVFAGMGLTHADADAVRDVLEERLDAGELVLMLNTADDPVIERILTPRIALTVAEHLAFELGRHVLVVLADMTSYAEALREVSSARGELPGRRAYPGYLYSDLASLYERCGRIEGTPGSVTVVPVLTMPAGDITHPVPDLTGYITEGQVVLSREAHSRGVYPPVDPLGSLSRLMRNGAGAGHTREGHVEVAAQLLAALARARDVAELAELVGTEGLSATDRLYLQLEDHLERDLVHQARTERRTLDETLRRCWQVVGTLPRRELAMLPSDLLDRYGVGP
ncbi:V-type ATP synthase subunit B [Phycicoccus sp. Soil748]|uniref:V-type ATP synthase subunit B n=1 Tax=Phycicoccus sp. Soil748 TaxID=1736397 RepID=UPI000B225728|nr:V-type ATP synthase subunit B [Phycicoccus sp. Soil748]